MNGQMITIKSRGKTHTAKIVDLCPGCKPNSLGTLPFSFVHPSVTLQLNNSCFALFSSLDMSPSLFKLFAAEAVGVISLEYKVRNVTTST